MPQKTMEMSPRLLAALVNAAAMVEVPNANASNSKLIALIVKVAAHGLALPALRR